MRGATDGGAHIEAMRTEHMKKGSCAFSPGCGCRGKVLLEFHHEKYRPERGIYLSHHCHHRTHFRPYHLSDREKEKLLRCRHGDEQFKAFKLKPRVFGIMMQKYVAPGRRPAQLAVRREVRERARERESIHSRSVVSKEKTGPKS